VGQQSGFWVKADNFGFGVKTWLFLVQDWLIEISDKKTKNG
jgi:hypothetical protein